MRLMNTIKLMFWIVLFESIGFFLGLVTQANIDPWYGSLHKSTFTPPGYIFSVAWTLLYALLAVIAWILSSHDKGAPKKITTLFAVQMLMNWTWTLLFFKFHWLTFGAIWLISLTCLNFILIIEARKTHKTIAWLLLPYVLWLVFASYLNGVIALTN
jgi:tryptophan-rich sensory protein